MIKKIVKERGKKKIEKALKNRTNSISFFSFVALLGGWSQTTPLITSIEDAYYKNYPDEFNIS